MLPLVLVYSCGTEKPIEIIKGLISESGNEENTMPLKVGSKDVAVYKFDIVTKYYETQIAFLACDEEMGEAAALLPNVECGIVYFDSDDNDIATEPSLLPQTNKVVQSLLTSCTIDQIYFISRNISNYARAFKSIKDTCKAHCTLLDVSNGDSGQSTPDYGDLLEILQNNVWSNVSIPSVTTTNAEDVDSSAAEEENMDRTLNEFEDLLNSIHNFKLSSVNLSRNEMLRRAEILAEKFSNIIDN